MGLCKYPVRDLLLEEVNADKLIISMKNVTLYIHGTRSSASGGPGGFGVVLEYNGNVKKISQGYLHTRSNRMELIAITKGLEALKEPCNLTVVTANQNLLNYLADIPLTQKKLSHSKSKARNKDLWPPIFSLASQHKIIPVHRNAINSQHSETASKLARSASKKSNLVPDLSLNRDKKAKSVIKSRKKPTKPSSIPLTCEQVIRIPAEMKIFTDGACEPNPGKAGSGIAVYRNNIASELWYGLYNPSGTNNLAELNAIHQALIMADAELNKGGTVAIFCDSQYAINCVIQWASGWEKKGWKKSGGGEIKNLELIKKLHVLYQSLSGRVQILHVNGHAGVEGNELADRMSVLAIKSRNHDFSLLQQELDVEKILSMSSG